MIESRLLLAKKLLNPKNSVLIVTIDEKEYLHLGCLLEEMFPEANIQMVSSVIAQSGVARNNSFYRTNEFIYIVQFGDSAVQKLPLPDEWKLGKKKSQGALGIVWNQLRRTGTNSLRTDRQNLFYPIIFNENASQILDTGEAMPLAEHPSSVIEKKNNHLYLWPIKPNGIEGNWQLGRDEFLSRLEKGYVKWGKILDTGISVTFLKRGSIQKIEKKEVELVGRDVVSGTVLVDNSNYSRYYIPGTQWNIANHDASYKGTQLLSKFIGNRFPFPKSLYAVHDAIRFFVANNPNALILDFFSGSGTTLHAVNLLNKEDGGHRRCIMVTNNEVSVEEEKALRAKGLHKGDEEWEKFGIARYVNWPRTKCSILGVDVNGQPIKGDYITSNTEEKVVKRSIKQISLDLKDDSMDTKLKKQIVALIGDKKMPQNAVKAECPFLVTEEANKAILFDVTKIDDFMEEVHDDVDVIYIVTSNNKAFNAAKRELEELPERIKTVPVSIPMADGFAANAAYYKLTFLDKEKVSLGTQLEKLLPILWMKAGAHGVCPTHVEDEYTVFAENKMAILNDEFAIDELKAALQDKPEVETVYIIDDSEENYRTLAASLHVRQTYQLYRDYLDNFKINIEKKQ